jgi:hypothetical protein
MKTRQEWSDEFNSLPLKTRITACAVSNEWEINAMKREKARLIKRFKQSLKEIDEHIKNLERWYVNRFTEEIKEVSDDTKLDNNQTEIPETV